MIITKHCVFILKTLTKFFILVSNVRFKILKLGGFTNEFGKPSFDLYKIFLNIQFEKNCKIKMFLYIYL